MIEFFKKLLSRKYKHIWKLKFIDRIILYPKYQCDKCNAWKDFSYFGDKYICGLSDDEFIIKNILE